MARASTPAASMSVSNTTPLNAKSKKAVLAFMNGERPDDLVYIVRHYVGKRKTTSAKLTDVDNELVSIDCVSEGKKYDVQLPYVGRNDQPLKVTTVGECRGSLIEMARIAFKELQPPGAPTAAATNRIAQTPSSQLDAPGRAEQTMASEGLAGGETGGETGSGGFSGSTGQMARNTANPAEEDLFQGEGSRLGGGYLTSPGYSPAPQAASTERSEAQLPSLPELDPEKPVVRLKVVLVDRRPATVMVNRDYTLKDLRALLEHYQGESCAGGFHLMDVGGFPPKKYTDLSKTVDELGLASAGSLACRRA